MRTRHAWTVLGLAALAGCWPGPQVGRELELSTPEQQPPPEGGGSADGGVRFSQLEAEIFTPTCASSFCHKGAPPPRAPMSLEAGAAYASLMQTSSEVPSMKRVVPGDPGASYLMLKLKGLAGTVGSSPARMPLNKPPLDPAKIQAVEAWILRGAPHD